MICRIWHGRTPRAKAEAYAGFLEQRAIPDYRSVPGNLGAAVLRRDEGDATHFLTVTRWEAEDRIRAFAGDDLLKTKYYPEDQDYLLEFEPQVRHYTVASESRRQPAGEVHVKLRFTGEWPPPGLWTRFPNWEPALDEEAEPGQDESTLRPGEDQRFVVGFGFTAGEVEQANGQRLPALISICDDPDGVTAFTSDDGGWSIQRIGRPARWICTVEDWLPEAERSPSVSFDDTSVFPLRVRSHLPGRRTGKPLEFVIRADGTTGTE